VPLLEPPSVDELFGISLNSIMVALLLLLTGALAVVGWIAARRALLVRMGLRNARRRVSQTVLIVVGLMLSTLIISAAFATGDTVGHSVTNEVYSTLQAVDFVVGYRAGAAAPNAEAEELLDGSLLTDLRNELGDDPDFDAFTGVLRETVPAVNTQRRLSEPRALIVGVDPATIDEFGILQSPGGDLVTASELRGGAAFISSDLADNIDVAIGDDVTVFVNNQPHVFRVAAIVRDSLVSGGAGFEGTSGGLVISLDTAETLLDQRGRLDGILVSAAGGVRDSAALKRDAIEDRLEAFIEAHPEASAEVALTKEELATTAQLFGSLFVTFFLVFGLFSIAAGIMLIFLIFVMLAAERRSEMGMARAVGMSRMHLTESFLAEGMAYNVGSAAVGALLGLAVSALLIFVLGQIAGDFGLSIAFHFNPRGFVVAYSLGVVLTFITVTFAAYRAANLNIVRAIRDLPEPQPLRGADRSLRTLALAVVAVPWVLAWLAMAVLWGAATFGGFILGLSTYGLGLIGVGALGAAYVWGALHVGRPKRTRLQKVLFIAWWALFNLLALLTWFLFRTRDWSRRHRNPGGWAIWMLLVGLFATYFGGWQWHQAFAYQGGTTLVVLAVAMLAVYFGAASRPAFTVAGLALVWYWLLPLPFSLFMDASFSGFGPIEGIAKVLGLPRPHATGNIEMFFVSGICITAAATLVIIFNADVLLRLVSAFGRVLGGIAPALKTAVAYPLAARFRTGMTLAMFGLVVFSLVVMSTLNSNFTQLFAGDDARAGFDVTVDANPANRIPDLRAALQQANYQGEQPAGVGTLLVASRFGVDARQNSAPADSYKPLRVVGGDNEFLQLARLPMQYHAVGYETDAKTMDAVRAGEDIAFIDQTVLALPPGAFGGPPSEVFQLDRDTSAAIRADNFEPVPVILRGADGNELRLRIVGVMEQQVTGVVTQLNGLHTTRANVDRVFDGGDAETFFVTAPAGSSEEEIKTLADNIESALLERGVQASSIRAIIQEQAELSTAFQYLFEGFMALGLVVGIAALGVIAFRTVVERRQQIGMLRAIGYTRRLVALSFFLESSFIALAGIAIGLVLGGALSYNLMTSDEFTGGGATEIDFRFPWGRILLISAVAYGASALMTLIPARAASRIAVAEALRYE
jgi:putative ABC transport system permease protein